MDKLYEPYCLADRLFYDAPGGGVTAATDFAVSGRPLPEGLERAQLGEWLVYAPAGTPAPETGWTIDVSACPENADEVVAVTWVYCVPRGIPFRHLRSPLALHTRKYTSRPGSGGVATVYPAADGEHEDILAELGKLLAGQRGPVVPGALRYGDGPLYVRRGSIAADCSPGRPDGTAVSLAGLPYRVQRALRLTGSGGVYLASDTRSGQQVILKEARPCPGPPGGGDAVSRLRLEGDVLARLSGLNAVPGVRDWFQRNGHHFLVLDHVDGEPLSSFVARRHPLLEPEPDPAAVASYTGWAVRICRGVEEAAAAVHARGVVINGLQMSSVIVRPDGSVALTGFKAAAPGGERHRPAAAAPGSGAPAGRAGFAADRYRLACLRLAMFLPLTGLLPLQAGKAGELAEEIAVHFPVPRDFLDRAVQEVSGQPARPALPRPVRLVPDPGGLRRASRALARAVLASATPQRPDRLFPGDIRQFAGAGGGLCLAYGAAGVLYALSEAGEQVPAEHVEWLITHATQPERGAGPGLYTGLLGAAYVLSRLGHREPALRVAGLCLSGNGLAGNWHRLGSDLAGGLSGIALGMAYLGAELGEPALTSAGKEALEIVAGRAASESQGIRGSRGTSGGGATRPGLLHGAAGPALLFIRAYEQTGDTGYLDLADAALRSDLGRCATDAHGALRVERGRGGLSCPGEASLGEGSLGEGSVGIGLVLDDYLAHRADDESLTAAATAIRRAACVPYCQQPGLFNGRGGMILHLARQGSLPAPAGQAAASPGQATAPPGAPVAEHVRRLAWHAIRYRRGVAFPGENLHRLSMDLATGTAGVLLSLAAVASQGRAGLPFLGPLHGVGQAAAGSAGMCSPGSQAGHLSPADHLPEHRLPVTQIQPGRS